MASLMEDLIDVLNKEEEQYQGLIELGKKKREVVIRADIKTLDEITATEQEVASNLQNLAICSFFLFLLYLTDSFGCFVLYIVFLILVP